MLPTLEALRKHSQTVVAERGHAVPCLEPKAQGPAAVPPEHVACGTRRRIEILRKERKPMGGGGAGAKRAEGEIKGGGCDEVKSLSELGLSLDTVGRGYPANSVGVCRGSDFFVVDGFCA
jgi:hypothetical protein